MRALSCLATGTVGWMQLVAGDLGSCEHPIHLSPHLCDATQPRICKPKGLPLRPMWQGEVQRSEIPRKILLGMQKSPNLAEVVIIMGIMST